MSVTYGFYNSKDGDRKYNATQMSSIFDGIIRDGVLQHYGTALMVEESEGMVINVGIGRAWFNHTWTLNDALLPLTVSLSELILHRIDAVVLEVDAREVVRANSIKVVKGTPSSEPIRPSMIQTHDRWQYPLAYIRVNAGVSSIRQADITNCVGTSECPFVTAPLEKMSIDALVAQWEDQWKTFYESQTSDMESTNTLWKSQWEEYFDNMRNILDEDTAANLANQIIDLQERMENLKNFDVVDDLNTALAVTEAGVPVGCKAISALNNSLGGLTFEQDAEGNWGYKPAGADTVIPFKNGVAKLATISGLTHTDWGNNVTYTIQGYQAASQFDVKVTKIGMHLHGETVTSKQYNTTIVPKIAKYDNTTGLLTITNGAYINSGDDNDYKYRFYVWASEIEIFAKPRSVFRTINSAVISNPVQNGTSSTTMQYDTAAVALYIKAVGWTVRTGTGHFIDLTALTGATSYSMFFKADWGDETTYTVTVNPATRTVTCNGGAMGGVFTAVAAYAIE